MLGPFLWMVFTSLKRPDEAVRLPITFLPDNLLNFTNYQTIFATMPVGRFLLNSTIVTILGVIPSLVLSALAGYAFAKLEFPGKEVCFISILAVLMLPFEVTFLPLYIVFSKFGLINTYVGIAAPEVFSPLGIFLMRQFMQSIPNDYLDAGRIDGTGELELFWRIAAPLMKPALLTLTIIKFIFSWNSFLWPLVMTRDESMMTLTVGLANLGNEFYVEYTTLTAAAAITVVPILILYFILQRQVMQGMIGSGVKG